MIVTPPFALALHGGAGTIAKGSAADEAPYRDALLEALAAGQKVLIRGGSALDAVIAGVVSLEDCPLFNAGRGAVFTSEARHELGMEPVPFHKFADLVKNQVKKLNEDGDAEVAFRVAIKDGKVSLTARAMRGIG